MQSSQRLWSAIAAVLAALAVGIVLLWSRPEPLPRQPHGSVDTDPAGDAGRDGSRAPIPSLVPDTGRSPVVPVPGDVLSEFPDLTASDHLIVDLPMNKEQPERSMTARRMTPKRVLPEPTGPKSGESVEEYVRRVLDEIHALDSLSSSPAGPDDETVTRRMALELELEAYATRDPQAVHHMVAFARASQDRRVCEIDLIVLGRVRSRDAVDFLFEVAEGKDSKWAERPAPIVTKMPDGSTGTIFPSSLGHFAVRALFQDQGGTGPPYSRGREVRASNSTSLTDPYVFGRLVDLAAMQTVPIEVRLEIVRTMDRNLPDPFEGGGGDFPRPAAVATAAEGALRLLMQLSGQNGDPDLARAASSALGHVDRPEVAGFLLERALREQDPIERALALQSVHPGYGRKTRDLLLAELSHADLRVRLSVVEKFPPRTLAADSVAQKALLTTLRTDPAWSVRVAAVHKIFTVGDPGLIRTTVEVVASSDLRSLQKAEARMLRREMEALRGRRGFSDELEPAVQLILGRLGQ